MHIEKFKGDFHLMIPEKEYLSEPEIIEAFKQAYREGLLPEGQDVFYDYSRMFTRVTGSIMKVFEYRDNWNGWNDLVFFTLPDFTPVGRKVDANSSSGRHRTEIILEN